MFLWLHPIVAITFFRVQECVHQKPAATALHRPEPLPLGPDQELLLVQSHLDYYRAVENDPVMSLLVIQVEVD